MDYIYSCLLYLHVKEQTAQYSFLLMWFTVKRKSYWFEWHEGEQMIEF